MLFDNRPKFHRPTPSPYRQGNPLRYTRGIVTLIAKGLVGVGAIILLVISAVAGPGAEFPKSRKGWFAFVAFLLVSSALLLMAIWYRNQFLNR